MSYENTKEPVRMECLGGCGDKWKADELCSKCGRCFYCCKHEPFDYGKPSGGILVQ